ncbi:two-component sensor histidine kinase, partial [Enterococcus faecalis]
YPRVDSTKNLVFSLMDKNWDQIMKGNRVFATENIDIYGARNISSYVLFPVYASNQSSDKKVIIGTLVITQPAKNVHRS